MSNEQIMATAIKKIATILNDELYANILEDSQKELTDISNAMFNIIQDGEIEKCKQMTLRDFLRTVTQAEELCVIREDGWIVATFWIDHEDLFCRYLSDKLGDMIVKGDEWDYLPTVDADGNTKTPLCHYIDV